MPTPAENVLRQYAFIEESTYGTTPATPQTQLINVVDFTGDEKGDTITSETLVPHRQIVEARRGNSNVEGNLIVELEPDNVDWALEAVTGGTFATNVLKVGSTFRSFAIEEGLTDKSLYRTFNGVILNTMAVEIVPNSFIKATFGFIGSGATAFAGTSIDSSATPIVSKPKFFHEGGTFKEGGSTVGYVTAISFDLTNNAKGNNVLGSSTYHSVSRGKFSLTGKVSGLIENATLYNKFKNNTDSVIEVMLGAGAETLTLKIPKVKYTEASLQRSGDGPITVEMTFTATYDASDASTLVITRA